MKKAIIKIGLLALSVMLFFPCTPVRAAVIKIGLTGLVDSVNDPYDLLENEVQSGDSISGYYTYDSLAQDLYPASPYSGGYHFSVAPYGISLTVGGLTFQTDPANVDFTIYVEDNYAGEPEDSYRILSITNLPLDDDIQLDTLGWRLVNYSGTALSSDDLLPLDPDLSKWQYEYFIISGGTGGIGPGCYDKAFYIYPHLTSVWLIPEPATLLLFGLGGLILRKRS